MDPLTSLNDYGDTLVTSLGEAVRSQPVTRFGPVNASGQLAASLRKEAEETATGYRLSIYASSYVLTLLYGRRPGKFPPLQAIRLWIDNKGIVPRPDAKGRPVSKDSLAFLIGRKLAQNGNLIYQQGAPSSLFQGQLGPDIVAAELARLLLPVIREQVVNALR